MPKKSSAAKTAVPFFKSFGFDDTIIRGVARAGYRNPTPIQRKAMPLILSGKDVVAMARTGSGKTAAFLLPLLQKLKIRRAQTGVRALLISPTRELALQTLSFLKLLGKFTGLRAALLIGGDSMEEQFSAMHENPDIIIATPGRLLHLIVEMDLKLRSVEYVVFDEADRLFELGFETQLHEVLSRLPSNRQTLLFSATLPRGLVDFAKAGLRQPELVRLDLESKLSAQLQLACLVCRTDDKLAALLHLLTGDIPQTLVFCATRHHVDYIREVLSEAAGINASYIYSSLDPVARKHQLRLFRDGVTRVLIVTDLAARGVDLPLLDRVINFNFPPTPKLFVHRVGRVARAGRNGIAVSLLAADELPFLVDLHLYLNRDLLFATIDDKREEQTAIGRFPDALLDEAIERLKHVHDRVADLVALKKCAENALKQYLKSRPQPSNESIRRTKLEFAEKLDKLAVHAMFAKEGANETKTKKTAALLQSLKEYRPAATVFEFAANNKRESCRVMKAKRAAHGKYVRRSESTLAAAIASTQPPLPSPGTTLVPANEADLLGVFGDPRESKIRQKKAMYFVPYQPADFHTEHHLAVERTFDRDAQRACVDFTGDEGELERKDRARKHWDRKRKRFVGTDDAEGKPKKIRTESGVMIAASYKSDRYARWKKKSRRDDDGGEDEEAQSSEARGGKQRGGKRGRAEKTKQQGGRGKPERKTAPQVLKARERKQKIQSFQKSRQQKGGKSRGKARKNAG